MKLIHDYLSNRKQRTKINSPHIFWHEIIFGVPQGSSQGPLLFDIFLIVLFFIVEDIDIASYEDENTPYISANNINEITDTLFKWFNDNLMKSNSEKCYLLVSTNDTDNIKIVYIDITSSTWEKLLGLKFDHKLTFHDHLSKLCKKGSRKIHTLARVTPDMNLSKKGILMSAFFISQFSYYPLVWMCHSHANNSKINRLHKNNDILTNSHRMKRCWKRTTLFSFITETYKF